MSSSRPKNTESGTPDTLRVLLVEDSFAVAQSFSFMMEEYGWSIIGPAPSVEVAIDLIERHTIDVAVLDINLRGVIVTPVAQRLTEMGIAFLFLTGYGDTDDMLPAQFKDAPMLLKPVDETDLIQTVQALLNPPRTHPAP
jgi:CheY-like chemotaxis protein